MIHGLDTTFLVQVEVREAPGHEQSRAWLEECLHRDRQPFALAPQVLAEFIHVITDPRRFSSPLTVEAAVGRAQLWLEAKEVKWVYPGLESTRMALHWQRQHRLGRKRVLDTQLAATYHVAGIERLRTLNFADFEIFGVFQES